MTKLFPKFLFIAILFLIFPAISFAQVVINEIMYAPASGSGEWVEIFNSGESSVDLSNWRFFNNNDDSAPFRIQKGSAVLVGGGYAIITTTSYWSSFSGTVFSSSQFSLPDDSSKYNTYKAISDSNKKIIDSVTYDTSLGGSKESGNSLQKSGSNWITASPTPGAVNNTTSNISDNSNTSGEVLGDSTSSSSGSSSSSSGSSLTNVSSLSAQLDVQAGSDRTTSPGSPIWFQATVKKNTTSIGPELNWSFGDGNVGVGPLVSHTYKYSGDYVVVLSANAGDIFSVSRFKVKVADSNISIADKGEYLEISNNGGIEVNLFRWKIENNGKGFVFQPNTIVLPHSSIKLDKVLLTMKGYDNSLGISLKDSLKEEIFAVAPVKEVDINEMSLQANEIQRQAYSLLDKAISAKLVTESSPITPNIPLSYKDEEVRGDSTETETSADNIIYEAPKQSSLLAKIWTFLASMLP